MKIYASKGGWLLPGASCQCLPRDKAAKQACLVRSYMHAWLYMAAICYLLMNEYTDHKHSVAE